MKAIGGLDPRPSDAELLRIHAERTRTVNGVVLGPNSPLRRPEKRRASGLVGSVRRAPQVITDDVIDPTGRMNAWERQRAGELEVMRQAKLIRWWKFDALSLRLADKTFYHTDFAYQTADKDLVVEEVKGFMRDDAAVKVKVAASQYPHIRFLLVRRTKGEHGWTITEVRAA